jgi:ribosomal protein S18 acetylase RimI-like enzyme
MIVIRKATPNDALGIAHVHVESWRTTYAGIVPDAYLNGLDEWKRAQQWREMLIRNDEVLIAERDGEVVGFITGGPSRDNVEDCDAELYAIYLLKEAQRSGIGIDLLRELARSLTQLGFMSMDVWVLETNSAKGFYARMGAHYATSKKIEIGGAKLMEEAFVWPDLRTVASLP